MDSVVFHVTVVACGSATGFVVPPVFRPPGETGSAITMTESGFMNKVLFASWLPFFTTAVPTSIRRPLLFIMDGCGTPHFRAYRSGCN
ncbi:Hypothetical protein PHPALM_16928 [Phytophthora palmivora]|uniref:Uncharacterized protein n=1 Tax=Phytophthora palmivora TaxID=4796 RepID=A0A2P4XNI5_9STRA|nr:Hypothetical protein PHPALM_16928 [Phytophthora palmivora]